MEHARAKLGQPYLDFSYSKLIPIVDLLVLDWIDLEDHPSVLWQWKPTWNGLYMYKNAGYWLIFLIFFILVDGGLLSSGRRLIALNLSYMVGGLFIYSGLFNWAVPYDGVSTMFWVIWLFGSVFVGGF